MKIKPTKNENGRVCNKECPNFMPIINKPDYCYLTGEKTKPGQKCIPSRIVIELLKEMEFRKLEDFLKDALESLGELTKNVFMDLESLGELTKNVFMDLE